MAALAARPPLSLGQHPTRNADSLSDCLTAAAGLDEGLRHYFKNRVPAGEQLPYAVVGGVAVAALLGVGVSKAHHEQIYHPSHMPTRSEELEVMLHSVGRFTKVNGLRNVRHLDQRLTSPSAMMSRTWTLTASSANDLPSDSCTTLSAPSPASLRLSPPNVFPARRMRRVSVPM